MSWPDLVVAIDFVDPPLTATSTAVASGNYVNVSAYVRGEVTMHRGRQHERQEFEAGTVTLTLKNTGFVHPTTSVVYDRAFDPDNTAGPYYGYVVPMRKVYLQAVYGGTTYAMYDGFVESWRPRYDEGNNAVVDLTIVDGFKIFNLYTVGGNMVQELGNVRIGKVLDAIGWSTGRTLLPAGLVQIQENVALLANALTHMQAVARTEGGQFFMAKNGNARFERQSYRSGLGGPYPIFGDDPAGTQWPYAELETSSDDTHIWNYIATTREGGQTQYAQDAASIAAYCIRRLDLSGTLHISDATAEASGRLALARFKDARTRIERIRIDPGVRNVWPTVLGLEISQVISVMRQTLLPGSVYSYDHHIESIDWRIRKGSWILTMQLSPKRPEVLGTVSLSTGTRWTNVATGEFLSGWGNYSTATPPTETPAGYWRDSAGWVYLRGLIKGGTVGTSGSTAFILPPGFRPPYDMKFTVISNGLPAYVLVRGVTTGGTPGVVAIITGDPTQVDLIGIQFRVT